MRKFILAILALSSSIILNGQWVEQKNVGTVPYEMQMLDSNNGFIGTQLGLLKTTNGWQTNSWCLSNNVIYGYNAINANTILSVGINLNTSKLNFSETVRGCNSWNSTIGTHNGAYNSINSYGDTIITPVTSTQIIISNDFGGTWDTAFVNNKSATISQIEFMNSGVRLLTTFVSGKFTLQMFRSTDYGQTWDSVSTPAFDGGVVKMFVSEKKDKVWAVGKNGSVSKSDDLGKTWIKLTVPSPVYLVGVHFINDSLGFVCGGNTITNDSGRVYRTTNGGATWEHITPKTNSFITDVYFVNDTLGFATAHNGQIFKTTNAGGPATKDSLYWSTDVSEIVSEKTHNISLFPNPSTGLLNIKWEFSTPNKGQVILLDSRGRIVYKKAMPQEKEINFNLEYLSPGMYFVSLDTPEGKEMKRWIKE